MTEASGASRPGGTDVRVAMIGLGRMGGPMADNVIVAGFDAAVYDIDPVAVQARVDRGARGASTIADACSSATFVGVVVFDDEQAIEVIAGLGGVLASMPADGVIALHTTVTVDTIERLGRDAAARGIHLLDAGVSGGEHGAQAGSLVTMVGGAAEAVAQARPVLDAYSREVVHAGPLGAGMALKLARNAVGYVMMAAGYEALRLATAAGIDPAVLRHVLDATDLPAMLHTPSAIGGPAPFPADADPAVRRAMEHTYRLAVKDLAQALAFAGRHGITMPTAEVACANIAATVRLADPSI